MARECPRLPLRREVDFCAQRAQKDGRRDTPSLCESSSYRRTLNNNDTCITLCMSTPWCKQQPRVLSPSVAPLNPLGAPALPPRRSPLVLRLFALALADVSGLPFSLLPPPAALESQTPQREPRRLRRKSHRFNLCGSVRLLDDYSAAFASASPAKRYVVHSSMGRAPRER